MVAVKIYLYGIQGVYNYGCEAMVRAISERLKNVYPSCDIIYKTENIEDDKKRLQDCNTIRLESIEKKEFKGIQKNIIYRSIRFIKKKLGIAKTDDYIHINTDWIRECDVLVIIGGDVFDRIPSQKKYQNNRILISKMVKEFGGKVVLWGISIGSFEDDKYAKRVLFDYFENIVDLAIIRDEKSYDYLRNNGIKNNIALYSDPAYMIKTIQCEKETKNRMLGINLSPLSNRYLNYDRKNKEWTDIWTNIIYRICEKLEYKKIILIPHVVMPTYETDDDFGYLKKISNNLKDKGIDVCMPTEDKGFIGIKDYIIKCDLIISARMHCAINAITCGVPTIFLSYSPKSIGMCKHVYGTDNMFVDMNDLLNNTEENIDKFYRINSNIDKIKEYLSEKNVFLYEDAYAAGTKIKEFLGEISNERIN